MRLWNVAPRIEGTVPVASFLWVLLPRHSTGQLGAGHRSCPSGPWRSAGSAPPLPPGKPPVSWVRVFNTRFVPRCSQSPEICREWCHQAVQLALLFCTHRTSLLRHGLLGGHPQACSIGLSGARRALRQLSVVGSAVIRDSQPVFQEDSLCGTCPTEMA